MTDKELGLYLKNIRESKKISLRQVDYQKGITYSHLSMIENGARKVTPSILKKLAEMYGLDYIDLYEKAGYIDLAESEKLSKKSNTIGDEVVQIPVYGKISAGLPIEMQTDSIIDHIYIEKSETKRGKFFALEVVGDSMDKIIPNGSRVVVRQQEELENGEIGVIAINGYEATVKRYERDNDNVYLYPESNNPEHRVQRYSLKETPVSILGKVEGYHKKL